MDQLTNDMHGPLEGEQAALTMIAYGEPASACLAPSILNVSFEAREDRLFGPVV